MEADHRGHGHLARSAAFSISGLTAIFAGAFWPVIGLGIAFESSKLSATAILGRRHVASRPLRAALAALVGVLMVLNSIGVYGFLSRAHLEHALAGDRTVASRAADVEARLGVQAGLLADMRYLATLLGWTDEQTMRWFILVVALLLDPAAVLLLLAATHGGRR